eukprot:1714871-Amphidinium_carterae.1
MCFFGSLNHGRGENAKRFWSLSAIVVCLLWLLIVSGPRDTHSNGPFLETIKVQDVEIIRLTQEWCIHRGQDKINPGSGKPQNTNLATAEFGGLFAACAACNVLCTPLHFTGAVWAVQN